MDIAALTTAGSAAPKTDPLREKFNEAFGTVFYTQMVKAMRQGVGKTAYLHGGMGEDMFQGQLDSVLVEKLAQQPNPGWNDALFQRFRLGLTGAAENSAPPADVPPAEQQASSAGLAELTRQARAGAEVPGMTTGAAVMPALIRK